MKFYSNYSLRAYNTFGLDVEAKQFGIVEDTSELLEILKEQASPVFVLGGGSNILLTKPVEGLVLKNNILGKTIVEDGTQNCLVSVGAGENWHEFVLWCIEHGLGGIENLSLIPGTVGAAPIQNIGAYGVELEQVFHSLEAIHLETGVINVFDKKACDFAYRSSVFKKAYKGQFCITSVQLKLTKLHHLNLSYGTIGKTLKEMGVQTPTIKSVSDAIIQIRQSKLPDPVQLGNAGSFFKNPEIPKEQFETLQVQFPNIVHYPLPKGGVKVPAGWLIEQCGWKGKVVGNTGCYKNQALVIVNYGGATGQEILELSQEIIKSVQGKFGILLELEVNVI